MGPDGERTAAAAAASLAPGCENHDRSVNAVEPRRSGPARSNGQRASAATAAAAADTRYTRVI